ncbi:MAG: MBL fold metallo-hydrolase [Betaproteobacteria bacterium]|nr:MBL fold metallo-hydrolase [Pseudomonadota bacterium]NBO04350.1 MBL fold metallo-hydrolase [Betaproteobacteria bacterium]NDG05312.1 MBL fold metallo-hydrolase [Alphaproteobacteria bacterium]NBO94541.1 MBL fold metallo-hydrolase [Betaproteobacteria bacterium]NBP36213.1 MBL fold metallo-hydrolase [Betaproteobacteria bacterium]
MDPTSGFCEGCLRNIDEIASWGSLNDAARLKVLAAIKARRKQARASKPARVLCDASSHPQWPDKLRFIQRDWLSCNSVLILDDQEGATLFDSGYIKHAHKTREQVHQMLGNTTLRRLVNTHLHSDHCGANALLQQSFDCELLVPAASFQAVRDWDAMSLSFQATGQRCQRFHADASLKSGDKIESGGLCWEAHAAPGHDPESLVFFEASHGLLISADVLWADGFGVIFPELEGESGFSEQEAMLDLIEFLQPRWVFPGHGPAFADVDQALLLARKRLVAMRDDPAKHARHALKVLLKFLMLDLEWADRAALDKYLATASLPASCAKQMQMQAGQALAWAIDDLIAQGQLRQVGTRLLND